MTTEVKLCSLCGKNEVSVNCEVCGIPMCDMCVKKVLWQEASLAAHVKPGVYLSPLRPGQKIIRTCPTCMKEAEFYEGEYY
ncbi:MAG: hypothetical protein ACE5IE_04375 [Dehalococcoidia bacterium]